MEADGSLDVDNAIFEKNKIKCKGIECGNDFSFVFYNDSGPTSIDNTTITRNSNSCKGDDCFAEAITLVATFGTASMTNSQITDNKAECKGLNCDDETFPGSPFAGGLQADSAGLTLTSCAVSGNKNSGDGAGITNHDTLSLIDTAVSNNSSSAGEGGGIYNDEAGVIVEITTSPITGNSAVDGGGVANYGAITSLTSAVSSNTPNDCVNLGSGTGCP